MQPNKLLQFKEMLPERVGASPEVDHAQSVASRKAEAITGSPIVAGNGSIENKNWTAVEETDMILNRCKLPQGFHDE